MNCYSSNGQSRKPAEDGESRECRPVVEVNVRYCVKFMTSEQFN